MDLSTVWSLLAPEVILLVGGCVVLFAGVTRFRQSPHTMPLLSLLTLALAFGMSAPASSGQAGDLIPGLLITPMTQYARLIGLPVGALLILVNWMQPADDERGEYMSLVIFSLLGVLLTASANDLLVLFFAIELVSVPTYVLVGLSRLDGRAPEASIKYFFLGAMAAAVLAYGLTFLYGVGGTTTMSSVGVAPGLDLTLGHGSGVPFYGVLGLLLVFSGLCFKVAAVPFHVYAPDVYEGAASPITGLLGFVPKLAGFIAMVKVFALVGWDLPVGLQWLIWAVAIATMTTGNVLALLQNNAKRMLAYSSIAHTGYMLIAVLVGPVTGAGGPFRDGVAAMMFYIGVYGVMNLGAFALLASFKAGNKPIESVNDLSGLASRAPAAALALAICLFSLMGLPPTAGFLGKVYVFSSAFSLNPSDVAYAFHQPLIILAVIGVLNSAIGAAYYLRLIGVTYTGEALQEHAASEAKPARWSLAICSILMLVLFVRPSLLSEHVHGLLPTIMQADQMTDEDADKSHNSAGEGGAVSPTSTAAKKGEADREHADAKAEETQPSVSFALAAE